MNGARVLVAGAAGVLGDATTVELADRGARPALVGRRPSRLARAAPISPGTSTAPRAVTEALTADVPAADAGLGCAAPGRTPVIERRAR
ncbi:hypothetical protein ABZ532_21925 [Streptomyces sp. NPDC019396]|uniref:hypothetical protein n=1 Tax=Streptomyces sp. NPDC019396 TaxID=3154687 RepID=UPI003406DCEE